MQVICLFYSLAFFLASSNISSLNNVSPGIHSAKRKISITLWRGNFVQSGLLMKGLLCFRSMDAATALDCDTAGRFSGFAVPNGKYLVLKYILRDF